MRFEIKIGTWTSFAPHGLWSWGKSVMPSYIFSAKEQKKEGKKKKIGRMGRT